MTDRTSPNLSAPSGSDLGEGLVERVARLLLERDGYKPKAINAARRQQTKMWTATLQSAASILAEVKALSTPSSTSTPDADGLAAALRSEGYWQRTITLREDGGYEDEHLTKLGIEMRAARSATPAIRDQAFEEAARKVEKYGTWTTTEVVAGAIRALKGTPIGEVD